MNFEHNIWRAFDRAYRKIAQMVMATDLPREDPSRSDRTRNEFSSNASDRASNPAMAPESREELAPANGVRTKGTASNETGDFERRDKSEVAIANGLLNCSNELSSGQDGRSPNSQVLQLRQLLLLHLELIQQQQEQLQSKDKELNQLKIEKEQLEARIQRMVRRMAMKKKHGTEEEDDIYSKELPTAKGKGAKVPKRRPSTEQLIRSKRVPIQAPVVMTSSMCDDRISCDTHLRTETLYLSNNASISSCSQSSPLPAAISDVPKEKKDISPIAVPSWTTESSECTSTPRTRLSSTSSCPSTSREDTASTSKEEIEDLDDEAFFKRHSKLEIDEKRRKRWDIQRLRSLSYHETLEKKHLEREQARLKGRKSGKDKKDEVEEATPSFLPKPENIMALEVSDTVPVVAFGAPIPLFHSKEFDLPWFSLEKRELQERGRATRGRATRGTSRRRVRSRRQTNPR